MPIERRLTVELPDDQRAAVEQARWLAELAQAIARAQRLTRSLAASQGTSAEVRRLCGRLEAVELEVEEFRRGSRHLCRRQIDPKWTGLVPWNRRREG
ncbi:MAG TPA: hypothetical protein VE403_06815 [Sphingomicrobium sp.]|jgi:hypothetical protein|nr:hypothetical protein [Sphingomicrobium sp.]